MIKHFIIMASAYSIGKRIALDFYDYETLQMDVIQQDLNYIMQTCGSDVPISTHFIQTEKLGWEEVIKLDKFFASAELIDSKEEFAKILMEDRTLKGIDIARYILTMVPCTHLKLEKLVYMCYADYLCEFHKPLFKDKIYAYRLGPVVETVYEKYKMSGQTPIEVEDDTLMFDETEKSMPFRSRILSSEDGLKKLISIDKTLSRYSKYTASDLVNITHRPSSPWDKTGIGSLTNNVIGDKLILEFHKYETV